MRPIQNLDEILVVGGILTLILGGMLAAITAGYILILPVWFWWNVLAYWSFFGFIIIGLPLLISIAYSIRSRTS